MKLASTHPELPLAIHASDTLPINGRCTLKKEGVLRAVYIAGLPAYHWAEGDLMAESHAMVSLVRCGYADQNEVARAFGCSTRTLRRRAHRFETGGMSALGREAGRPRGSQRAASAWASTAKSMKAQGLSVRGIAQKLGVSKSTAGRWTVEAPVTAPPREAASIVHGCDADPRERVVDRVLARLGMLEDAQPIFTPGRRIPHAGVLLAVPALMQSGILSVAEEVYGQIGPAFYGLRTTMMALLLMALLRIKRPEELKERAPVDLGRVLGLDRAPEVKTLRRKLSRLAVAGKAEIFGRKLAERRVADRGKALGFLYADGHVRVYHGKRRLSKAHVTRMRLALPATTDYWVNDKHGDPLFVVTAELNAGLAKMLPVLTAEIRSLLGPKRRVTLVFDRGGWSPKLFKQLIQNGFDVLTYRKGRWRQIPATRFATCVARVDGRTVRYELDDRSIRLLNGSLRLRQITRLTGDGHQTPIVTSRLDMPAAVLAYRMFERWRQENFFKYLRQEFALDALVDYTAEPVAPEQTVPNPERRKVDKELVAARAELREVHARYGEAAAANEEGQRPTMRGFKIAHGELGHRLRAVEGQIAVLEQQREQIPARVAAAALGGEPLMKLSHERKHLTNCIKMVAYQAESDLLALMRPHYARADDEGRTLITTALQSAADLEIGGGELRVTLAPLSSAHRDQAMAALCEALNRLEVKFPGTELRMRFGAAS